MISPRKLLFKKTMAAVVFLYACKQTTVIHPLRKDIVESVYASGKIVPENEYRLSAMSNGTITSKLVKDGDIIRKGQVLYIVNSETAKGRYDAALQTYHAASENLSAGSPVLSELRLSMENAEMKAINDSITYFRYRELWNQEIGTRSNLDNMLLNYRTSLNQKKMAAQKYYSMLNDLQVSYSNAKSQLTGAGRDLKEFYIRSDRDGTVFQTAKEAGENVYTGEVVALLGGSNKQLVRLAVDQQDIGKVRKGQQVLLQADITGDKIYTAEVSAIFPAMNENDQTFRADAIFLTKDVPSFIHSSVEANIIVAKKTQALVIPKDAVESDSVLIRAASGKKKIPVRTGISTIDFVEILSGLNEKSELLPVAKNKKQ